MEREDWDKAGEGSREGQSGEKWRELISIDHHRQLHYQHLLDTRWIQNHFLLCVGGCMCVPETMCVCAVESLKLTVSIRLFWVCLPPKSTLKRKQLILIWKLLNKDAIYYNQTPLIPLHWNLFALTLNACVCSYDYVYLCSLWMYPRSPPQQLQWALSPAVHSWINEHGWDISLRAGESIERSRGPWEKERRKERTRKQNGLLWAITARPPSARCCCRISLWIQFLKANISTENILFHIFRFDYLITEMLILALWQGKPVVWSIFTQILYSSYILRYMDEKIDTTQMSVWLL